MRPTPRTRDRAGRSTSSPISRRRRGSIGPVRLKVTHGKRGRGQTLDHDLGAARAAPARASATRDSTSCSARHMSVPGANCSDSSTAPRMVRERRRSTPSTVVSALSSGRVSAICVDRRAGRRCRARPRRCAGTRPRGRCRSAACGRRSGPRRRARAPRPESDEPRRAISARTSARSWRRLERIAVGEPQNRLDRDARARRDPVRACARRRARGSRPARRSSCSSRRRAARARRGRGGRRRTPRPRPRRPAPRAAPPPAPASPGAARRSRCAPRRSRRPAARSPALVSSAIRIDPSPVARSTAGDTAATVPRTISSGSAGSVTETASRAWTRTRSAAVAVATSSRWVGIADLEHRRRRRAVDQLAGLAEQLQHHARERAAHGSALELARGDAGRGARLGLAGLRGREPRLRVVQLLACGDAAVDDARDPVARGARQVGLGAPPWPPAPPPASPDRRARRPRCAPAAGRA